MLAVSAQGLLQFLYEAFRNLALAAAMRNRKNQASVTRFICPENNLAILVKETKTGSSDVVQAKVAPGNFRASSFFLLAHACLGFHQRPFRQGRRQLFHSFASRIPLEGIDLDRSRACR